MATTVATVKETQAQKFARIIAILRADETANADLIELCEKKIEQATKKAETSVKSSKTAENEPIAERLYELLKSNGKAMSIAEIQAVDEELSALGSQKFTAVLNLLTKSEPPRVTKEIIKKVRYYSAV